MKKILLLAALAFAASCSNNELSDGTVGNAGNEHVFYASFESDGHIGTRTSLGIAGGTGTLTWSSGDRIGILNSAGGFDDFTLSGGKGTPDGEFTGVLSPGTVSGGLALYPAGRHSYDGDGIIVNLPSSYGDRSIAYSGNTNAAMMAEAEGNNLSFRHLGGLLCFTVVNLPEGTNEVSLTGRGICGDFQVAEGIISKSADAGYGTVRWLFSDFVPVEGTKNRRTFYFPLPVGEYEKFTVNILGDNVLRSASIAFGGPKKLDRTDFVKLADLDAAKMEAVEMNRNVFELLNLDYPGLEKVKSCREEGDFRQAAAELLDYYRNRTSIKNISVSDKPSYTATDLNRARQATREEGYRFYVKNFVEDENGTSSNESDDTYYSFSDGGGGIDWTVVPAAAAGNQEWKQRYRMQWMVSQAKVYAVTKDEKYFEAWKEILDSFMSVCCNYKEDGGYVTYTRPNLEPYNVAWAALQVTARLEALLTVFEYYKHSGNFTPGWLTVLLGYVYDHVGSMLANPYSSGGEYSNITTGQHSCKILAGLYMPEFTEAGEWLEEGARHMTDDVGHQFRPDGVLGEFDYGYHVGTLHDYIGVHNAVQANIRYNDALGGLFPADYTSRLRNAANFVQDYIYPDYTVEGFSDTRPANVSKSVTVRNLQTYDGMFPDGGHFKWMASQRKSGQAPSANLPEGCPQDLEHLSLYPVSGYYMFRSGWSEDDIMLIHKNNHDTEQRYHNQWDNGTVSLYRNGRRFMPDASVPTYGGSAALDALRAEYASSAKHSTVTRGGNTHNKREGRYVGSGKSDGYEYVVTENEFETFAGGASLIHRRSIFFVGGEFFVLADDVSGTKADVDIRLGMMLGEGRFGAEYVCPGGNGNVPFTAYSNYPDNNNMFYRTFISDASRLRSAEAGSDFYVNDVTTLAAYDSEKIERAMYQVTMRKGGVDDSVRFVTVIHPIGSGSEGRTLDVEAEFDGTEDVVAVSVGGVRHELQLLPVTRY